MTDCREDLHVIDGACRNMLDLVSGAQDQDRALGCPFPRNLLAEGDINFEPHNGIEFESHEAAYQFYQEYAKSMGFTTSIKNSRRSKKSKDFIDAKFACSRYGVTPETDSTSSRRPTVKKTDCKASMHVKRNKDGKWVIHDFVKDHNHELLPALAYHFRIHRNVKLAEKNNIDILHAVSERTKKMYVQMSRQSGKFQEVGFLNNDINYQFENEEHLILDEGDAQILLDYFTHIKRENPKFFYAIDLNKNQQLRNLFWVDAKSRIDYVSFSDVVSLDTSYMRSDDKMPLVLFVGVNHHFQSMFLGCALVADESKSTFVWLLKTWLRAMNSKTPEVIVTEQKSSLKDAVKEVLPMSRHCFPLYNIMEKVPEVLAHVIKGHEHFPGKFNKCILKSWTEDKFEMRWWKMVSRFDLQDDEWVRLLYEDRKKWVPLYLADTFLAGMSALHRFESLNSFFDKYIHKKITLKEFVKQYGAIIQNRYEEEAIADFDTWHKQPALKSPSPWEKQMSTVYTHVIFKKFQVEVLGVVGCHPKREVENGTSVTYRVEDCEKDETFFVAWDETKSEISCLCRSFEYKGFLCRHALIVLQICGISSIPSKYILRRWTKDAKRREVIAEVAHRMQTRVERYNDLCKQAIGLSEEGSVTEESYRVAFRALVETLKNCVNVNNSSENIPELSSSTSNVHDVEEGSQGKLSAKTTKRKNIVRKRKVPSEQDTMINEAQDSLHQMESLRPDGISLNGYYGSQQKMQGSVQLNLMEPPHDGYYVSQQSIQGLGQLNSLAPGHDGFFEAEQNVHGLGNLDFQAQTSFTYSLLDEQHDLRPTQMHGNAARHS